MLNLLYPKISNEVTARKAANHGAFVAGFHAASTIARGFVRIADDASTENMEAYALWTFVFFPGVAIYLGYLTYKANRVAATIIFVLAVIEIFFRIALGSFGTGLLMGSILLLLAWNGVRGSFAFHKPFNLHPVQDNDTPNA